MQQACVERFKESYIVMGCFNVFLAQPPACLKRVIANVANGDQGNIFSIPDLPSPANFHFFHRGFPNRHHPGAFRISDDKGAFAGQLCGIHHIPEFLFIHG